jgi:hypothetical protein
MKQQTRLFFVVMIVAILLLTFAWRYAGENRKLTSPEEDWRQEALAAGATKEGANAYSRYREVAEQFCVLGHLLRESGDLPAMPADPDSPQSWLDRHPEARMSVEERARRDRWLASENPLREW